MWKQLKNILISPVYVTITLAISAVVLVFSIWLPNLSLVWSTITSHVSVGSKLVFLWNSLGALGTNFSALSATLTVLVSALIGLNVAAAVFYFRKRISMQKVGGLGAAGILLGLLGVGCASCGSVILATFIGVGGTAALAAALPLGGQEFSIAAILVLLVTLYVILRKTDDPMVCAVEPPITSS